MAAFRLWCANLVKNHLFEFLITGIILVNSVLIGVETYTDNQTIKLIQSIILGIFTFEIVIRFFAAGSVKAFFLNGWNVFDLVLVLIGYIPPSLMANSSGMMAFRVLRVFRVLRLLRAAKEIKLIVTVLVKSLPAMFYNLILLLIFVYLYAIAGVAMFKLPNPDKLEGQAKANYEKLMEIAPNAPSNSPDPYGTIGEAVFTLFRALTGEDWTDLRYNLVTAYKCEVVKTTPLIITTYHVSWFIIAAFLLLNLVTGAVINNYQVAIEEREKFKKEKKRKRNKEKIMKYLNDN